jgi:hypothetical protein
VLWRTADLSLYIGAEGEGELVIKVDEWLALMGRKQLGLNWYFTPQIEGGEMGVGCGAALRAVTPWRARPGQRDEVAHGRRWWCLLCSARGGRRKLARPGGPKGRAGRWGGWADWARS